MTSKDIVSKDSANKPSLNVFQVSNRRLFEALELTTPVPIAPDDMKRLLDSNYEKFLKLLSSYKPPSSESKKQIESGKVTWNSKQYELDEKQREFVIKISNLLQLDEIQCFRLLQTFIRTEIPFVLGNKKQTFEYSDAIIDQLVDFYFDERKCLLNCLCSLFRTGEDESHQYNKICSEILSKLLSENLGANTLNEYKRICNLSVPKHLTIPHNIKYANQNVLEQFLLLELLFLIYYTPCPPDQIINFLKTFQSTNFGERQVNYTLLNENGRKIVKRIEYLSVLISIESLNLESLLEDDRAAIVNDKKSIDTITKELSNEKNNWGTSRAHGPFLLAWTAVLGRLQQLKKEQAYDIRALGQKALQLNATEYLLSILKEFGTDEASATGYKSVLKGLVSLLCVAFNFPSMTNYSLLIELYCELFVNQALLCDQYWEHEIQNDALRSILDTALSRFPLDFNPLVKLLTALASGVNSSRRVFQFLVKLSSVTQTLDQFSKTNFLIDQRGAPNNYYSHSQTSLRGVSSSMIVVNYSLAIFGGLILPENTTGYITYSEEDLVQLLDIGGNVNTTLNTSRDTSFYGAHNPKTTPLDMNEPAFIQWKVEYSAWYLFALVIDDFIGKPASLNTAGISEQLSRIHALLLLVDQLLQQDERLAVYIELHLQEIYSKIQNYLQYLGISVSTIIPRTFTARLFLLFQQLSTWSNPPVEILTACLRCINGFTKGSLAEIKDSQAKLTNTSLVMDDLETSGTVQQSFFLLNEVFSQLRRSSFIDDYRYEAKHAMAHAGGGIIRQLFHRVESKKGEYPITIAFLELLNTVLNCTVLWYPRIPILDDGEFMKSLKDLISLKPYIGYLKSDIFSTFETWRYVQVPEKYQIGIKVLSIFYEILSDNSQASTSNESLKEILTQSILYDSSFHHTLLNIVGMGRKTIEQFFRRDKERLLFEQYVLQALQVLENSLSYREFEIEFQEGSSTDPKEVTGKTTISSLEYSLLTKTTGRENTNFIVAITSYLYYPYNSQLQLSSIRLLSTLCILMKAYANVSLGDSSGAPNTQIYSNIGSPSLVGYLEGEAQALCNTLLAKLSDSTELNEIRIAILRLITNTVHSQPALAELLLSRDTSSTSSGKPNLFGELDNSLSCIEVINQLLSENSKLLQENPILLLNLLGLVYSIWELGLVYRSIVASLRSDSQFWTHLIAPLKKITQRRSSLAAEDANTPFDLLTVTWIVRIISLELFNTMSNSDGNGTIPDSLLKDIFKLQLDWLHQFAIPCYDSSINEKLVQKANHLKVDLNAVTHTIYMNITNSLHLVREGIDNFHLYEKGYYDVQLLGKRLQLFSEDVSRDFIEHAQRVNSMLQVSRAQLKLLRAWRAFIQLSFLGKDAAKYFPPNTTCRMIEGLSSLLQEDPQKGFIPEMTMDELGYLLTIVISYWKRSNMGEGISDFKTEAVVKDLVASLHKSAATSSTIPRSANGTPYLMISLFSSLALLIKALPKKTWQDIGLYKYLMTAIPIVCNSLVNPELKKMSVSLLDAIIVSSDAESNSSLLQCLQNSNVNLFHFLMDQVSKILQTNVNNAPYQPATDSHLIFNLILALATIPSTAEYIAISNFMLLVSNSSFPFFAQVSNPQNYLVQGERSTAHKLWTSILSIIVALLQTLGNSESFLQQVLDFLTIHQSQFNRVFQSTLNNTLPISLLEELDCITAILYETRLYVSKLQIILSPIIHRMQANTLVLMQRMVQLLLQPTQLFVILSIFLMISSASSAPEEKKTDSKEDSKTSAISAIQQAEYLAFRVLRNTVVTARVASPSLQTISNQDEDLRNFELLFNPQMSPTEIGTKLPSSISIGTLISCQDIILKKLNSIDAVPSKTKHSSKLKEILTFTLENTIYLLISYSLLFSKILSTGALQKLREDLEAELTAQLGKILRTVPKSQDYFKTMDSYRISIFK